GLSIGRSETQGCGALTKTRSSHKRWGGSNEAPCELFTRALAPAPEARVNNSRHIFHTAKLLPKRLSVFFPHSPLPIPHALIFVLNTQPCLSCLKSKLSRGGCAS